MWRYPRRVGWGCRRAETMGWRSLPVPCLQPWRDIPSGGEPALVPLENGYSQAFPLVTGLQTTSGV